MNYLNYYCQLTLKIKAVDYKDTIVQADVITFFVAHKEFKSLEIKTDLDFCGVTN